MYNTTIIYFVGIIKCCDQSGDKVSKNNKRYNFCCIKHTLVLNKGTSGFRSNTF